MSKKNRNILDKIIHRDPVVETRDDRRRFRPEGEPPPTEYIKAQRQILSCPQCRRERLDNGGQAVECKSSGTDLAYFRCKVCDHQWKLSVKVVA